MSAFTRPGGGTGQDLARRAKSLTQLDIVVDKAVVCGAIFAPTESGGRVLPGRWPERPRVTLRSPDNN